MKYNHDITIPKCLKESTCIKGNIPKLFLYWEFTDSISLEKKPGLWITLHKDKNVIHIQNPASSDKTKMANLKWKDIQGMAHNGKFMQKWRSLQIALSFRIF